MANMKIDEFPIPVHDSGPRGIACDEEGRILFALERNKKGSQKRPAEHGRSYLFKRFV